MPGIARPEVGPLRRVDGDPRAQLGQDLVEAAVVQHRRGQRHVSPRPGQGDLEATWTASMLWSRVSV